MSAGTDLGTAYVRQGHDFHLAQLLQSNKNNISKGAFMHTVCQCEEMVIISMKRFFKSF